MRQSMPDNPDRLTELVRSIGEEGMTRPLRSPRFGTLAIDEDIAARFAPRPPRVCPRCHGSGKVGPSLRGWTDPERERDCDLCGGDGEVAS